ncbi:MAG TPA: hypothetical protein VE842_17190 [Pyrinomonadaceae bacterium]|jgi:hypothetical protein|nr:hypothetical protein [Pyrinomonadaceae bacterium]
MALVKAHIVLDKGKAGGIKARSEILDAICERADISSVNEKRLERYGVLTCDLDDSRLDAIREIPGVAAVEVDRERDLPSTNKSKKEASQ